MFGATVRVRSWCGFRIRGFETYLHVGCAQIRRYGSHEPMVLAAILQMLSAVAQDCVGESRRAAVKAQIEEAIKQHAGQ